MSPRKQSKIKRESFVDATYSSGDNDKLINKSYQEENNNEVDGLSQELQMGCIVDAVKRPPNICVETCVYEDGSDTDGGSNSEGKDEDAYSDEFEEDRSEDDSPANMDTKAVKSETERRPRPPSLKLAKSHSFTSSKPTASVKSISSSQYGCMAIPKTRRVNMSFTNERLREIERHNHILLSKILDARNVKKSSIPPMAPPVKRPLPSAAFNRKKQQQKIDHDNMILLRRIQRAKSSANSIRR